MQGSYGFCPFNVLTGLACPGCGGLRATHDLTNLDVVAAVSSNLFAVVLLGFLAVTWAYWTAQRWRGHQTALFAFTPVIGYGLLAFMVVFTIVRNTPWGAALAP